MYYLINGCRCRLQFRASMAEMYVCVFVCCVYAIYLTQELVVSRIVWVVVVVRISYDYMLKFVAKYVIYGMCSTTVIYMRCVVFRPMISAWLPHVTLNHHHSLMRLTIHTQHIHKIRRHTYN